ncbi:uncharacterized protein LOC124664824 [Lolium rigidum]|uniref:uncharacterized protein LOC124664824 n=1 Tax=Lolium rigidum TaxID=89674 RepID=UPI001F5D2D86|nr:uncharacterized protein LOC124664824 [Lolium rigidum]
MEPTAANLLPETEQLAQGSERRGWGRWAFLVTVSLLLTGSFAWGVFQARHSRRDLTFVIVAYYLIALLWCCLAKLKLLCRDDPAVASKWRRVRFAAWVVFVTLAYTIEMRVAEATPDPWLKNAVWWLTSLGICLAFYFFIAREDAGRRTDSPLLEVSPEQRV